MFLFLSRSKYGPLVQAAVGVLCVVIGLFVLTKILLALGAVLIVWAAAIGIGRMRARVRETDESPGL